MIRRSSLLYSSQCDEVDARSYALCHGATSAVPRNSSSSSPSISSTTPTILFLLLALSAAIPSSTIAADASPVGEAVRSACDGEKEKKMTATQQNKKRSSALFLEEHIRPLFTRGTTVLTMEHEAAIAERDGIPSPSSSSSSVLTTRRRLGWERWWLEQFEEAAVVRFSGQNASTATAADSGQFSSPSFVTSSSPLNDHNSGDKYSGGGSLLAAAFSFADFDRLLVTTTGIESCFDEVNRQMRKSYCSADALRRSRRRAAENADATDAADDNNDAPIVCSRECHPVSEVDELGALSRHFKDKLLLRPSMDTDNDNSVAVGDPNAEDDSIGKSIVDAFKMPSRAEEERFHNHLKNKEDKDKGLSPASSSLSPLSIFSARHFIESLTLFIEHYYVEGDQQREPSSSSPSTVSRLSFFNTSSIVPECRSRIEKLRAADRREGIRGAGLLPNEVEANGKKGRPTRAQLIATVRQMGAESIDQNDDSEQHRIRRLTARLPRDLREQYVCFLKFYGGQPTFQPLTGAQMGAELWLMNIGPQRLMGLERQLVPTPYGGRHERWWGRKSGKYDHVGGEDERVVSIDASGSVINTTEILSAHPPIDLPPALFTSDATAEKRKKAKGVVVGRITKAHAQQQRMAPLRQMAHRTGKTLIVRDADGRHPIARYAQLLVKQTLLGAEAAAADVGVQIIYEPPPKVTEETLFGVETAESPAADGATPSLGGNDKNRGPMAQTRFSSQPPRFDMHDTILIMLSTSAEAAAADAEAETLEASGEASLSVPPLIRPAGSRLVVTLQRSATHCHMPLKPCGGAKYGGNEGSTVGGKVEREFYYAEEEATNSNKQAIVVGKKTASAKNGQQQQPPLRSAVPFDEAVIAMPVVSEHCLRPRLDYYTSPHIDARSVVKGRTEERSATTASGGEGGIEGDDDDEEASAYDGLQEEESSSGGVKYRYSLADERDPNTRRVVLERAGDMLYIPRGMIYSYRTMRTLRPASSNDLSGAGGHHKKKKNAASIVSLDGALFLALTIEPITANHDASTFAALLQSELRAAYFSSFSCLPSSGEKLNTGYSSSKGIIANEKKKKKKKKKSSTDYCHDSLNAAKSVRQRSDNPFATDESASPSEGEKHQQWNPLRAPILRKDMGMYAEDEDNAENEKGAAKNVAGTEGSPTADSSSDGGFMRLRRKPKTAAKVAPPLPMFPTECFNEAHFALLFVEALLPMTPSLRRAVVRVPSFASASVSSAMLQTLQSTTKEEIQTIYEDKEKEGGGESGIKSGGDAFAESDDSEAAYAAALRARHSKWLRAVRAAVLENYVGGSHNLSTPTAASDGYRGLEGEGEDPVGAHKKWVRLVLGTIFADNGFLFDTAPLWAHESTPFRDRMVPSSLGGDSPFSHASKPHQKKKGHGMQHFFTRQCSMRTSDVIKLLTAAAAVPAAELALPPHTHATTPQPTPAGGAHNPPPFSGYSVVAWKHNHALELVSLEMKKLIIGDLIVNGALRRLMCDEAEKEEGSGGERRTREGKEGGRGGCHTRPRRWLSAVARRKHVHRAGTHYWHELNTLMAASSGGDVEAIEDGFVAAQ